MRERGGAAERALRDTYARKREEERRGGELLRILIRASEHAALVKCTGQHFILFTHNEHAALVKCTGQHCFIHTFVTLTCLFMC
jgi:hypothetical protein